MYTQRCPSCGEHYRLYDNRCPECDEQYYTGTEYTGTEQSPSRYGLPTLIALIIGAAGALAFLFWVVEDAWLEPELMDRAGLHMPFDQAFYAAPTELQGVPLPPEQVLQALQATRAFFAADFTYLQQALSAERERALTVPEGSVGYNPFVSSLTLTALAGVERCEQWLKSMPESYLAHWICAEIWNNGAWDARSERRLSDINLAQTLLLKERLQISNHLLEHARTLDDTPVEALTLLAENHFLLGTGMAGFYLDRAAAVLPRYLPTYRTRANFLQPRWGGSKQLVQSTIEQARLAGVSESDLFDMRDEFLAYPTELSTPGATREYWESAIGHHPTRKRLIGLMYEFANRQNWKALVPAAEAVIANYPQEDEAYYWLAEAKKMLGQTEEARAAYLSAAAMGNDDAMQVLIMAFIRGGLGIDAAYSGPSLPELCGYSAALGSPIGANCLGAGFFEGGQPGVPFERDPAQGYAWHLLASRAGHYNSQFDLGWMLYTGRVAGIDREQARELGIFWLRRAEEKRHVYAERRLDELNVDRSKSVIGADNLLMMRNALRTALLQLRQRLRTWADTLQAAADS